ncbi:MAG TPA: class I SAM-dependent methyltransferase [Thermoanaerobaculia bacterium]
MPPLRESLAALSRRWSALRESRAETDAARRFWDGDGNGHLGESGQDHFWLSQPLVRRAVNLRVTGDPNTWPMEWFARRFAPKPLPRGLSIGCGSGTLERDVLAKGVCEEVEGVDFSRSSVLEARRLAEEAGLSSRLRYRVEDVSSLSLPRGRYDIVFFHGSLHHVRGVERLLDEVRESLRMGGLLYVDEYMGPSRSEWTEQDWVFARAAFDALPEALKNRANLMIPLPFDDPLESVRSSAILPEVRRRFTVVADRPYGGNILWFVLPCIDIERLREDATGALSRLVTLEDHLLEKGWVEGWFRILVARRERASRR